MDIIFIWSATALLCRLIERSWWSAGALLALIMWISALGTVTMAPEYYLSTSANVYLVILTLLTSFGAALGRVIDSQEKLSALELHLIRPRLLLCWGLFFSLLSLAITFKVIGVKPTDLISPINIMRAAQTATYKRYTTGLGFPSYYNISNALFLSYTMAATIHFVQRNKIVWPLMTPVIIYVTTNMLITTRAPILFMIILMVLTAVYVSFARQPKAKLPEVFKPKVLKYVILGITAIALMFFAFQVLRFGENSTRSSADVWAHLRRWPWGSLPGFSLWFDTTAGDIWERMPGSYTWMGIFDLLGLEDRVTGGFGDYLYLTQSEPANIYTMFRGLYLDFGFVGSGVFMFIIGLLGGISTRSGRRYFPLISISIFIGINGLVSFSFVVSLWAFTANIVALAFLPIMIQMFFKIEHLQKHPTNTEI